MDFILNVLEWGWVTSLIAGALVGWAAKYMETKPGRIIAQIMIKAIEELKPLDQKKVKLQIKKTMREQLGTHAPTDPKEKAVRKIIGDLKKRDWLTKKR